MRTFSLDSRKEKVYWHFYGSSRGCFITNCFLIFPITINGETRWLEKTKIRWKLSGSYTRIFLDDDKYKYDWVPIEFLNK